MIVRTRDEYVEEARRGAELVVGRDGKIDPERVKNAVRYAKWRWDAVQREEVRSL